MITNNKRFNLIKWLIPVFLLISLIAGSIFYVDYSYNSLISKFYSTFNQCNFEEAQNILSNDKFIVKLKKNALNEDLNKYFTSVIDQLCNEMKAGTAKDSQALVVFKEIKKYDVINSSIDKLLISLDNTFVPEDTESTQAVLESGIEKYNSKDYANAIALLKKIPSSQTERYSTAQGYITKCVDDYKAQLLKNADNLAADDYYTKAIDLLSKADTTIVSSSDADIASKISYIEAAREGYLAAVDQSSSETTSTNLMQSITTANINTLNIESKTQYLIYVNLGEQKTYVYEGSINDWNLDKSYDCSTGIEGQETPKGVFSVTGRGDWFFAEEYGQGGKYWVQFMGDYLFHSLPLDETATTILDYTLGVPASHGCIRLDTDAAKWIYDNVANDTKVIIN